MRNIVQLLQISKAAWEESIHFRGSKNNKHPALVEPFRVCQTPSCTFRIPHNLVRVIIHIFK